MEENFNLPTEKLKEFAKENLKDSRYQHSLRVAEYAKELAERYKANNVEPELAYFAGLAHDICKNCSDEELTELVKADGLGIDEIEAGRLNLLHGRAASVILKEKFNIEDRSILNAVAFHTFGHAEIDALGKIVYIADKIEPERPNTQNFRDFACKANLDELMMKILEWNMEYIIQTRGKVHPLTTKMHNKLKDVLSEN